MAPSSVRHDARALHADRLTSVGGITSWLIASPFPRDAALALLNGEDRLTRAAGSFLGQLVVDPTPLTEKQNSWLATLLKRAGLPPLAAGGGQ